MDHVAAKFNKNFVESVTRRAQRESVIRPVRHQLARQAKTEGENAVRTIHGLAQGLANQKLEIPRGKFKVRERLRTGSIAVTRVPPYDWPWTWNGTNDDAVANVGADQSAGTMACFENNGNNGGAGASAAAVGIFFRPPFPGVGMLNITAIPAFNYFWWTYNTFDSSHSDAWIGLYVGAFDLGGTFIGAPIDQQNYLWNESHDFLASPDGSGSNSGSALSAVTFVNGDELYEIWAWCGGSASGDGDHTFSGSYGGSSLNVAVPWIQLEYFGGDE
jgi:hypothetical protein